MLLVYAVAEDLHDVPCSIVGSAMSPSINSSICWTYLSCCRSPLLMASMQRFGLFIFIWKDNYTRPSYERGVSKMMGKFMSCVVAGNIVAVVAIMAIWSAACIAIKVSHLWGLQLWMECHIAVGVMERADHGAFAFACKVHVFMCMWASLDEDEEEGL